MTDPRLLSDEAREQKIGALKLDIERLRRVLIHVAKTLAHCGRVARTDRLCDESTFQSEWLNVVSALVDSFEREGMSHDEAQKAVRGDSDD